MQSRCDVSRDRGEGSRTGKQAGSGFNSKECTGARRRELDRERGRRTSNLSKLSNTPCFAGKAYEEFTRSGWKRNKIEKNLWNLSKLWNRSFSPLTRNWSCNLGV